ncbi:hypothetical protein [Legionella waltersii]|nr:hypothetical protein [Legionella waltersii]
MIGKKDTTAVPQVPIEERVKKKKSVHWNDNNDQGKIDKQYLQFFEASSPTKEILDAEIRRLMQEEGFSETDACSYVAKPSLSTGEHLLYNPVFYDSQETIKKRYADVTPVSSSDSSPATNQNSFFTRENLEKGIAALGIAVTIGFALSKIR